MTSPLSSASAASKAIRRDPEFEPDDQWKENLKAEIQLNLASMVKDAEAQRDDNLKKNPADSERLHREFSIAMDNIRKLATETYKAELDRERQERRWATGHELPPDLAETMKKEQQAILDQIQSGKSSNTPAPNDGPTINDTQESTNSLNRKSSTSSVSPRPQYQSQSLHPTKRPMKRVALIVRTAEISNLNPLSRRQRLAMTMTPQPVVPHGNQDL
ncbi:hypothetical protein F5050DRAFT_314408 [Lentinula boryana]|uniref:Uncharacterized protein n=1 Tax=Lentinula boryana TaxID=40481 RepID=A0ABQ8QA30_9AGAR|nr:hypothetical protein F5050DRAFT_314408 [Lentinula boryana]